MVSELITSQNLHFTVKFRHKIPVGPQPIYALLKTISQVNKVVLLVIQQEIPLFVTLPCY